MTTRLHGPSKWSGTRDHEGYVEYEVVNLVEADPTDGPANVMNTPGLPVPGSVWRLDADVNIEAYCKQDARIEMVREAEPNTQWKVTQKFSNKGDEKRCKDQQVGNPLMEPQKISGSFSKQTVEATTDRFGNFLLNSSQEQLRGAQVEFDESRPSVKIEQNVPLLELALIQQAKDCVNAFDMWGLPPRTIKLSGISWDKKYYGQCNSYYSRTFDFEINLNTWDRDLLDEGTKVLNGEWSKVNANWEVKNLPGGIVPNRFNPAHFIRFKDRHGAESKVVLDGFGLPWVPPEATNQKKWWCISPGEGLRSFTFFGSCVDMKAICGTPQLTISSVSGVGSFPAIITTSTPHGFFPGDEVNIYFVQGCTEINGRGWTVVNTTATTFSIKYIPEAAYVANTGIVARSSTVLVNGPVNKESELALSCPTSGKSPRIGFPPENYDCDTLNNPGTIHVEKYSEMNFFVLGIPASF